MTQSPERKTYPIQVLSACCPEAQADGVPCTSLGRSCDDCQRAISVAPPPPEEDPEDRSDFWGV
jgi:hypothetical protein